MGIQITVLGSGSAGNCVLVETAKDRLLVDAGLSARQITQRLQLIGRSLDQITGILLTHEHSDHSGALGVLCRKGEMPVYANRLTAEAVTTDAAWNGRTRVPWRLFTTGQPFEVGGVTVEAFSVSHDACDPVGFVLRNNSTAVGIVTDLGHATRLVAERIRDTDALILEANHDLKLLQEDTARPWATKQRIMSRHGHLSNDAAATLVAEVASDRLRHVMLAHLSRDCNRPELACRAVGNQLGKIGAGHIAISVAGQNAPTATVPL